MEFYKTKTQANISLKQKGGHLEMAFMDKDLLCRNEKELIGPEEFEMAQHHIFKEQRVLTDTSHVVYAIRSAKIDLKWILMSFYWYFTRRLSFYFRSNLYKTL